MASTTTTAKTTPRVGQPLPPIALPSLDGRTIRLQDYTGQRLLVFMWASW